MPDFSRENNVITIRRFAAATMLLGAALVPTALLRADSDPEGFVRVQPEDAAVEEGRLVEVVPGLGEGEVVDASDVRGGRGRLAGDVGEVGAPAGALDLQSPHSPGRVHSSPAGTDRTATARGYVTSRLRGGYPQTS